MLAKFYLCRAPSGGGACGACQSCSAFERSSCADFLAIEPKGSSRWIRLDAIIDSKVVEKGDDAPSYPLQLFLRTQPLQARHKVAIIEDADRLNGDAANALLKTLEEPNPFARMILTTRSMGRVPATILSRCLGVACEAPTDAEWRASLSSGDCGVPGLSMGKMLAEPWRQDVVGRLSIIARELSAQQRSALKLSEEFRAICDDIEDRMGQGSRAATAEAVRGLGDILSASADLSFHGRAVIAEAHRRVVGNLNRNLAIDALFTAYATPGPSGQR